MPDFTRIINMAYMRILARAADPGGLENYNRLLNDGMSEAQMRETLIRSDEYASKNPDTISARTHVGDSASASTGSRKKKKKRKSTKKTRAAAASKSRRSAARTKTANKAKTKKSARRL